MIAPFLTALPSNTMIVSTMDHFYGSIFVESTNVRISNEFEFVLHLRTVEEVMAFCERHNAGDYYQIVNDIDKSETFQFFVSILLSNDNFIPMDTLDSDLLTFKEGSIRPLCDFMGRVGCNDVDIYCTSRSGQWVLSSPQKGMSLSMFKDRTLNGFSIL